MHFWSWFCGRRVDFPAPNGRLNKEVNQARIHRPPPRSRQIGLAQSAKPTAGPSVPLKELWQHLPEKQRQRLIDRLSVMLHRQLLKIEEGGSDE